MAAQGGARRLGRPSLLHRGRGEEDGEGEGLVPDHPDGEENGGVVGGH